MLTSRETRSIVVDSRRRQRVRKLRRNLARVAGRSNVLYSIARFIAPDAIGMQRNVRLKGARSAPGIDLNVAAHPDNRAP